MIDRNFMLISRFDASFMSFVIIVHFYDFVHFSVYRLIVKLCAFERSKTKYGVFNENAKNQRPSGALISDYVCGYAPGVICR